MADGKAFGEGESREVAMSQQTLTRTGHGKPRVESQTLPIEGQRYLGFEAVVTPIFETRLEERQVCGSANLCHTELHEVTRQTGEKFHHELLVERAHFGTYQRPVIRFDHDVNVPWFLASGLVEGSRGRRSWIGRGCKVESHSTDRRRET